MSAIQLDASCSRLARDDSLEKDDKTKLEICMHEFFKRGGKLECFDSQTEKKQIMLTRGVVVYPVCSGGWCRSQSLWAYLSKFSNVITLMPPHAARYGWDPYNGKINREANREKEAYYDEYAQHFHHEKQMRVGFEKDDEWKKIEANPTEENLRKITQYYNDTYYGIDSKDTKQRIFITFEKNAHVVMHRLCQANESLKNVTVISISWPDTMTSPPKELNTFPRSQLTYQIFTQQLQNLFDVKELQAV